MWGTNTLKEKTKAIQDGKFVQFAARKYQLQGKETFIIFSMNPRREACVDPPVAVLQK